MYMVLKGIRRIKYYLNFLLGRPIFMCVVLKIIVDGSLIFLKNSLSFVHVMPVGNHT